MQRRTLIKHLSVLGLASFLPGSAFAGYFPYGHDPEICRRAWKGLSDFNAKRYVFRYIEPSKKLPKVLLYGDSISIGYTEYARQCLREKADVYRLHVNGGDSGSFIGKMDSLHKTMFQPDLSGGWDFGWDLIHFNVGLHDLKYIHEGQLDKKEGKQVASTETYVNNLRQIIKYLQTNFPQAKLVFATTTPVPEGEPGRFHGDAARYNEVALEVLKAHPEILVNDLYTFSLPVIRAHAIKPGNVHFNMEGQRMQGIEVAGFRARALGTESGTWPSVEIIKKKMQDYEKDRS